MPLNWKRPDKSTSSPQKGDVYIHDVIRIFTDGGADVPTAVHRLLMPVKGATTTAPVLWFSLCEICTVGSSPQTGRKWGHRALSAGGTVV